MDTLPPFIDSLTTPVSLAILAAGFLGLIFGALIARTRASGIEAGTLSEERDSGEVGEEWSWRHEKLVLVERQEAERLSRWVDWSEHLFDRERHSDTGLKLRYFHLAESLRELRQRVGTDHSRLSLVRDRLAALAEQRPPRPEVVTACLGMAGSHVARLETLRDALRPACLDLLALEEQVRSVETLSPDERAALAEAFTRSRSVLAGLPHDWHVLTVETDRKIRELLGSGGEEEQVFFAPLCETLLLDGAATASLAVRKPISPQRLLRDLVENLNRPQPDVRFTLLPEPQADPEPASEAEPSPGSETASISAPDPALDPAAEQGSAPAPGPPPFRLPLDEPRAAFAGAIRHPVPLPIRPPVELPAEPSSSPPDLGPEPAAPEARSETEAGEAPPPAPTSGEAPDLSLPDETSETAPTEAGPPGEDERTAERNAERNAENSASSPPLSLFAGVPPAAAGSTAAPADEAGDGDESSEAPPAPASETRSLLLFRSNDPSLWGQDLYWGERRRARSLQTLPAWAAWVSVRRLDTGERVFAPYSTFGRTQAQLSGPVGFNASNELFYGARHLGIFAESCPNEVETRFTYGGWGFGHRVTADDPENESTQACAWEGREIPVDTVFEIELHSDLPELGEGDRVLDEASAAPRPVAAFG